MREEESLYLRAGFVSGKAADAGHHCFTVKAADAARRKSGRKDYLLPAAYQYESGEW